MKNMTALFLVFWTINSYAQSEDKYWETWNKNYPEVDIVNILNYEVDYAKGVEKDQKIAQYYSRLDKYKFQAKYLGQVRKMDKNVLQSMFNVFKLFAGDPATIKDICDKEVLFKVGEYELWMPIQSKIFQAFENEVSAGDVINLYCLFFNEHNSKKTLYNTFLISEFN